MRTKYRAILLLPLAILLLASCRAGEKKRATDEVHGPRTALQSMSVFLREGAQGSPSAPMGVFAAGFLAKTLSTGVRSARLGIILTQAALQSAEAAEGQPETFTLIEKLNSMLHVSITDYLNRSTNRALALQEYLDQLTNLIAQAKREHTTLEARLAASKAELRGERKAVKNLERTIDKASRRGDFSIAGREAQDLHVKEERLASLEAEEETLERLVHTYEELTELANERLAATLANREALIAGVRVKEVEGLEALGIVEGGGRRRGRR